MYRKYIKDLENWMNNKKRKPLLVWGARQVGKSYLIKDLFAEKYFKNHYIYIDCAVEDEFAQFCEINMNVERILEYISLERNVKIDEHTLIIFDEVQECLPIITLLKYFCQVKREIPIIATGSMVRIKLNRVNNKRGVKTDKKFLFPVGKINQLTIYPMNFEEFLINKNKMMYDKICEAYQNKMTLDEAIHEKAMDLFHSYMLIGGMPEVVDTYLETNSYIDSLHVLKDLYDNYLSDMQLYQASPESIIRTKKVFENIYSQLNKENKNFKVSFIVPNSKNRDMQAPIDWLTFSFLVHKASLVKETITLPLIDSNESLYRLYLADIGMFSYQSGIHSKTFIDRNVRNSLSGIFYENYVATELINNDFKLFYWKGKSEAEFEFVIEFNGKIIPIDVKKNKGTLNSLEKFKNHNSVDLVVKVSQNNYGYDEKNRVLTIPFYEFFLVCKEFKRIF